MRLVKKVNSYGIILTSFSIILIITTIFLSCSSSQKGRPGIPVPSPPECGSWPTHAPIESPPSPIGGIAAIQQNTIYPESAKESKVEGTVIVQCFINEKGKATIVKVLRGMPENGFNEAAIEAIKNTRFEPAKQRGKAVCVWISIPVSFSLDHSGND